MIEIEDLFGLGGRLSDILPGYAYREDQEEMAQVIYTSLVNDGKAAIEAGTGIGKSFSYLSALFLALKESPGEKAVIATSTQALQSQLFEKDIPIIKEALDMDRLEVALLYGRKNYICQRRLFEALREETLLSFGEDDFIIKTNEFLNTTKTGAIPEVGDKSLALFLLQYASEYEECTSRLCPYYKNGECYFLRARERAKKASLIVTNQTLMLLDSIEKFDSGFDSDSNSVLPYYSYLVVDEAHHIEEQATKCFSSEYSRSSLIYYIDRISKRRDKSRYKASLLERVKAYIKDKKIIEKTARDLDRLKSLSREFDSAFRGAVESYLLSKSSRRDSSFFEKENSLLLERDFFVSFGDLYKKKGKELCDFIGSIYTSVALNLSEEVDQHLIILKNYFSELSNLSITLSEFLAFDEFGEKIPYIEVYKGNISIKIAPMKTGPILERYLVYPLKSVIYTSATLSIDGDFTYFIERSGLSGIREDAAFRVYKSPFDYESNLRIYIPSDGVSCPQNGEPDDEYNRYLTLLSSSSIDVSDGGSLVLFTSFDMMTKVYKGVYDAIGTRHKLLIQDKNAQKATLLREFKEDENSSLFATSSFWEGVDVQGSSLRLLIIARPPFTPPTDPIFKARMNDISENGGSPFFSLALPDCILRLKQGIGRLIRSENDKGVVILSDKRIKTANYGIVIQNALKTGENLKIIPQESILEEIEEFLF